MWKALLCLIPLVLCAALLGGCMDMLKGGSSAGTSSGTSSTSVSVLTDASLSEFVSKNPKGVLVDFYSPDCAHCKTLAPEFEKAAQEAGGSPAYGSVNAEAESGLALKEQFKIERYPTVLWILNGESVQELPPRSRTADKIKEFVDWVQQPALVEFDSVEEFDESVPTLRETLNEVLPPVIAAFGGQEGLREAFERAAQHYRGKTVFLFVTEAKKQGPFLLSVSQHAEDDKTFEGAATPEAVFEWVKELVEKKLKEREAAKAAKEEGKAAEL